MEQKKANEKICDLQEQIKQLSERIDSPKTIRTVTISGTKRTHSDIEP